METTTELAQKILVRKAVAEYVEFMNEASREYFAKRYPNLDPQTHILDGGRKYLRILCGRGGHGSSVHCFVDALTGDVYKAASYGKPALNGARYNLFDEDSYQLLKERWDPHGSYLYKR